MESGLKGLSKHHVCLFACSCRPDPSRSSTMIHDHVLTSDLRPHTCILSPPPNPSVPTSQRRVLKNAVILGRDGGIVFILWIFVRIETKERRKSPNLSTSSQNTEKHGQIFLTFHGEKKAGYCKPRRIYPLHLSKRHRGIRKAKRNLFVTVGLSWAARCRKRTWKRSKKRRHPGEMYPRGYHTSTLKTLP